LAVIGNAVIGTDISLLIQEARRGQPESLNGLMTHYRGYLRVMAGHGIDGRLRVKADPSDVAQEVLFAACRDFKAFRGSTEPELAAWLRRILATTIADLVRRYKGTGARELAKERSIEADLERSSLALGALMKSGSPAPSEAASERERGVVLANALDRLPEDHRRVIMLRDLEQCTWVECGRKMNRSPDAVRMLWTRAIPNLGNLVKGILE
jgi:RNA polymerase sigma-70 factor (ECF subfamily)